MKNNIILLLVGIFLLSGCATVFLSPNGQELANKHQILAILPPNVIIPPGKGMTAEVLKEQQLSEGKVFQQEIYTYLLKRKTKGQMLIDIQEIESTNILLSRTNVDISNMTTQEICELLKVDGLLYSQFGLSKPMSAGVAVAAALLVGFAATNEVTVSLSIKDCSEKTLIWKYDHKLSGGLASTPSKLVTNLMRDASKKMPYFKYTAQR